MCSAWLFLFIVIGWWQSTCRMNSVFCCVYHLPNSVIFQLPLILPSSKCSFLCGNTHSSLSEKSEVFKESLLSALVSLTQSIQTWHGLSGFTRNFLQRNYLLLLPFHCWGKWDSHSLLLISEQQLFTAPWTQKISQMLFPAPELKFCNSVQS